MECNPVDITKRPQLYPVSARFVFNFRSLPKSIKNFNVKICDFGEAFIWDGRPKCIKSNVPCHRCARGSFGGSCYPFNGCMGAGVPNAHLPHQPPIVPRRDPKSHPPVNGPCPGENFLIVCGPRLGGMSVQGILMRMRIRYGISG